MEDESTLVLREALDLSDDLQGEEREVSLGQMDPCPPIVKSKRTYSKKVKTDIVVRKSERLSAKRASK